MSPCVLITGGSGFLGRASARIFKSAGWYVVGIGRSRWSTREAAEVGYNHWTNSALSLGALTALNIKPNAVVHCAGSGSVSFSHNLPLNAFDDTVASIAELLDYLRLHSPTSTFIYPSSAAVYGAAPDQPLVETDLPNPVSLYGYHKLMAESLLAAYTRTFCQPTIAIRFFSIYGPGLRKQLLWDASQRFLGGTSPQIFWGTGDETRDWIHVDDAARLILYLAENPISAGEPSTLRVLNGASGNRLTVRDVLNRLALALDSKLTFSFNGIVRPGDPRFYHADTKQLLLTGWRPTVDFHQGLESYASWVRASNHANF